MTKKNQFHLYSNYKAKSNLSIYIFVNVVEPFTGSRAKECLLFLQGHYYSTSSLCIDSSHNSWGRPTVLSENKFEFWFKRKIKPVLY